MADDTPKAPQGAEDEKDEPRDGTAAETVPTESVKEPVKEVGGRGGLDPSRYGDWEKNGRCIDF